MSKMTKRVDIMFMGIGCSVQSPIKSDCRNRSNYLRGCNDGTCYLPTGLCRFTSSSQVTKYETIQWSIMTVMFVKMKGCVGMDVVLTVIGHVCLPQH